MSDTQDAGAAAVLGAALFLGVLQGLTEFLPVSSSGHLVLFQQFMEIGTDHVLFDLVLHLGTLVPVLYFYREHVLKILTDPVQGEGPMLEREGVRTGLFVILASIPTAAIGLGLEDVFEALFATPAALSVTFLVTAGLLLLTRRLDSGTIDVATMPWMYALALGVAQGMAITPGISRSGTTIAVALLLGLDRDFAARFSFLMSVPAIGGAVLLKLKDADFATLNLPQLGVGFVAALVTGYFALVLLVKLVREGNLHHFAWYLVVASAAAAGIAVFL